MLHLVKVVELRPDQGLASAGLLRFRDSCGGAESGSTPMVVPALCHWPATLATQKDTQRSVSAEPKPEAGLTSCPQLHPPGRNPSHCRPVPQSGNRVAVLSLKAREVIVRGRAKFRSRSVMKIKFAMLDCGRMLGVGIQWSSRGKLRRRAWRFRNPLWSQR